MVYGREVNGTVTTFGTTGYTYNNIFLLYDRLTDTVWYPLHGDTFDAIGGPERGKRIPFLEKPAIVTLREWRTRYPHTEVLLGDAPRPTDVGVSGNGHGQSAPPP